MGFFDKTVKEKTGGFSDVIRCDEQDYLVWRWHPSAAVEGELKRDTAIRTGINNDYGWSRVEYNGQTLYCVSSYLRVVE